MKRTALVLGLAAILAALAPAQTPFRQSLSRMKIDQKLGAQVPAEAVFKDETGKEVRMASILGKRPVILLPMFFLCRGVCGKEIDNLLKTVAKIEEPNKGPDGSERAWKVGKDFDVVLLSINPRETPDLALNKKVSLLKVMKGETNQEGYHFLTGGMEDIRKVTNAIGFGFDYDETDGRINHPSGLMVLTASGKVAQYVTGAEYPKPVMIQALSLADRNEIGKEAETVLLGCVMIDPITGERSLVIKNVVSLLAGLFALGLFTWIGVMVVKGRRAQPEGGSPTRA